MLGLTIFCIVWAGPSIVSSSVLLQNSNCVAQMHKLNIRRSRRMTQSVELESICVRHDSVSATSELQHGRSH